MSEFKVGDRVRCIGGCSDGCIVTITGFRQEGTELWPKFTTDDGHKCWEPEYCFATVQKTWDTLEVGDKLNTSSGRTKTVLAKAGNIFALSDVNNSDAVDSWFTVAEAEKWGFKLPQPQTEVKITELTLEDVAKLAGKDVSEIRIKEKENN